MAFLVTNPRHNGPLNHLIAKRLGVDIRTKQGRDAVADFKKTEEYRKGGYISEKELAAARAAKKKRTASSKKYTKEHGKSRAAEFIEGVAKPRRGRKGGSKGSAKPAEAAAKPARGRKKAPKVEAGPVLRAGVKEIKTARGVRYQLDGKFISKAAAFAKANRGFRRNRMRNPAAELTSGYEFLKSEASIREIVGAGAAGAAHFLAAPYVAQAVSKVEYFGIGPAIAQYAPYTATAVAASLVGVPVANMVGQQAIGYTIARDAFIIGIALDVMAYLGVMDSGRSFGDLAVTANPYGDLAVTANPYGDLAVTALPQYDGKVGLAGYGALGLVEAPAFGFEHLDYGDADMADAFLAGDDFDSEEGQALIDGPRAMASRFPANRASGMRRKNGPYSRHAGQKMHRWAWLIKLVGGEKARAIAALPPQERVRVIAGLKSQAQSYASRALNAQARMDYAAVGAEGAFAAPGAEGAYGATVALGAGF